MEVACTNRTILREQPPGVHRLPPTVRCLVNFPPRSTIVVTIFHLHTLPSRVDTTRSSGNIFLRRRHMGS